MTVQTSASARLDGEVRQTWDGGGIVDMRLEALQPLNGWSIEVDVGGAIVNIWNARILAREGDVYRLGPLDYNASIAAGETVELGVQVEGDVRFAPFAVTAAQADPLAAPLPEESASPQDLPPQLVAPPREAEPIQPVAPDATLAVEARGAGLDASAERLGATSLRYYDAPGSGSVGLFVEGESVAKPEGSGADLPHDSFAPGPLSTRGSTIVDSAGAPANIHGINWFGLETDIFTPHGLWVRNWRELMDEVKSLGFNTLRLPFSGELVSSNGGEPSGIDYSLNPDLQGLNGLQILDAIVAYADRIGLRVLLDYHRGEPGGGPNESGLWYGEGRTEADVIAEWRAIAERYKDAPAVIGADLMNEPHAATWGDGSATDWAAAAERIGDAVLAIAPDWLIVVEGISSYEGDTYWWGGNLQGVRDRPVELSVPDRLVYSPHDYPASVHPHEWFFDGTELATKFRENWGYIVEDGIAPVLLGEWGSRLEAPVDRAWARDLAAYLADHEIPWFWWSLNPNSGDTGGVLEDDWTTVRTEVTDLLEPFLSQTRPDVSFADDPDTGASALFTVTLDAPAQDDVVVKYATTDGTARAGEDYVATAGTLLFSEGEREKSVRVPILPDSETDGDEFFYLVLGGSGSVHASGTARIEDTDRRAVGRPFVDVAGAVVGEEATAARFRVILSEPAPRDITIGFAATREGARTEPTRGSFVIPEGASEATLELSIVREPEDHGPMRYTLTLTSADGAELRAAEAVAFVADEPPAAAEVSVGGGASGEPRLTVDVALEDDWGSGALFNVVIKNVSSEPVNAWQIGLDLPFDLAELWSAVMVSDLGDRVTLRNADWNGTIEPGASVDFGFISDDGGIVLEQILNAAGLELMVE